VITLAEKGNGQPGPDKAALEKLPKNKLIAMILEQREDTRLRLEEKDRQITELKRTAHQTARQD